MRPLAPKVLPWLLVPCLLVPCLLPTAVVLAGEREPAANGAVPPRERHAAELRAAAAIGRDLLATDPAVRERAVARLLARIDAGGDLGPFLTAMARATKRWADERERLLDAWIQEALHGTALERERAAKLIHALGPHAVQRMADEIRHARGMQPGSDQPAPAAPVPPTSPDEPQAEDEPVAPPVCCQPRTYNVLDLMKRGMNHLEIRSMFQKVPDASEVKDLGRGMFLVTAGDEGHAALGQRLRVLRARDDTHRQQVGTMQKRVFPKATAGGWEIVPVVYRAPRRVLSTPKAGGYSEPRLPQTEDPDRTEVHVGSERDAALWMRLLQHGPTGVRGLAAAGPARVAMDTGGRFFQGRTRTYRKGVVRGDDGWRVEEGTLELGIELDVAVLPADENHVEISIVASRSEIAEPMPTDTIQPEPDGTTFTLDRAEWSVTKTRTTFRLPSTGGTAFLSLGGLGSTETEHVIVILRVRPGAAQDK